MSHDVIDQVRQYLDFATHESVEALAVTSNPSGSARWYRRGPILAGLVALLVLAVAVPAVLNLQAPPPMSNVTYTTYVADGNVWIRSDCPNTDQVLRGNPDGLPRIGSTTDRDAIEAWFGNPEGSRLIPRNGEVWQRASDGSIEVLQVEDWMIEATLDDMGQCPGMPTSTNGVPVIYRIDSPVDTTVAGVASTTVAPTPSTAPPFLSESWETLEEHEVVGRVFPVVVWTGTELVVWGGEKPSETTWHGDGAAFDPTTRTWRALTASPLAPRSEHVAVWTGSEVVICCGRVEGAGGSAGAYDPAADSWREVAAPPISPAFAQAVWTGSEMIVFGGVGGGGTANLTGAAAFNPVSGEWRRLADLPYGIEREASSAFGDGVIFVWPSPSGLENPGPLSYDIASDTWTQLPEPPENAPGTASLVWTGEQLFAYGASQFQTGQAVGVSLTFDPVSQSWSATTPVPLAPTDFYEGREGSEAAVWANNQVLIWTGWVGTDWDAPFTNVIAYDPESDSWSVLDPAPVPAYGMWNEPIVWTGNELIAFSDPMVSTTPVATR